MSWSPEDVDLRGFEWKVYEVPGDVVIMVA